MPGVDLAKVKIWDYIIWGRLILVSGLITWGSLSLGSGLIYLG